MSDYYPDRWSILKIITPKETIYKVLAGWKGGYLGADSWKINSGITKIEDTDEAFLYHGYSGSVYHCNKSAYGTTMLSQSIYADYADQIIKAGMTPLVMLSEDEAFKLKFKD